MNRNLDDLTLVADSGYDMLVIEMEHQGFNFDDLRASLHFLLSRKQIADGGTLQADPVPMVRIPPNTNEQNQWVIKQALDTGVYGLVLPHLSTVEGAQAAVIAARYPQVPGSADFEPPGERGWWTYRQEDWDGSLSNPLALLSRESFRPLGLETSLEQLSSAWAEGDSCSTTCFSPQKRVIGPRPRYS